ncbi:hypothetical protein HHI36_020039 [Cryptolaemus montrouzieri]|uniref:Rho-GAP domain-containing protein n=1 Tax=Cryptolaemus montrouzieri TaxID=559131 RepID=A0ABD2NA52_9CUCU
MSIQNLTDEFLVEKFRREYSEQFHILVRMHLSFILDLSTNDENLSDKGKLKKWKLIPFGKKTKSIDVLKGTLLTAEGICHAYQLIDYLKLETNLKVEGIFRRTGSLYRQNELKCLLNQGVKIDLDNGNYSVHDCASVLKQFLSELPDPLLTESYFPVYCKIAELCGGTENTVEEEKLLEALQLILLLLPSENKMLLREILNLLNLTASYEYSNKMSPQNLATLFTPHLLCPRKLSAEQLHFNSQNLCGIIAFMIKNSDIIFKVPQKLILDFRVRFEKRVLQPNMTLNESVSDQYAANTVFTFLDYERTAKENESNPTETALAQLYAYIQSLPESSKKRRLVKQFNKENGHGTPLQVLRSIEPKNKSLRDSIKKHILTRKIVCATKKLDFPQFRSSSEDILSTPPQRILSRARLFCTNCDPSPEKGESNENVSLNKSKSINELDNCQDIPIENKHLRKSFSEPNLTKENVDNFNSTYLTSTPACFSSCVCTDLMFVSEESDRKSISPITRSTQRMTRAMQETMMTPRSRKPVLLVYGNNFNNPPKGDSEQTILDEKNSHLETETLCTDEIKNSINDEHQSSGHILTCSTPPKDLSFSSIANDFNSDKLEDLTRSSLGCPSNDLDCDNVDMESSAVEKELILKPKKFDEEGHPTVFETSF